MFNWKKFVIPLPQRVVLSLMCFLAVINAYTMRICLSLAIVDMVNKTYNTNLEDGNFCPAPDNRTIEHSDRGEYEWSEEIQGIILSSFYWGYIITHLPGGLLSEKFGGKHILSLGIFITAILTIITPFAIDAGGAPALIIIRILEGFGEGTTMPAISSLLASWIPLGERGKFGSLVFGSAQLGTIFATFISGMLIDSFDDWRPVFYFFGAISLIWVFFFIILCSSDPESHPYITEKEKDFLKKELGQLQRDKNLTATPWRLIFTNVPMLALSFCQLGDLAFYILVTDLPKYMSDVLHFDIQQNGLYSSLPNAMMWIVSTASGFLGDWLVKKNKIGITNSRKLYTTLSSILPAIFIIGASYAECDRVTVVALFTIGMGAMGFFYAGMRLNPLDLSPNYAGTLMAITNSVGAATGIVGPSIVGILTPNSSLSEWRTVFWIAFAVFIITNLVYLIWGSGEVQPFNSYYLTHKIDIEGENQKTAQKESAPE